jgi:hypothetical protein
MPTKNLEANVRYQYRSSMGRDESLPLADFIAIFPDEASVLASVSGSHA